MTTFLQSITEITPISRIRRNHGLEHATIHILSRQHPKTGLAGYSDSGGFWILGEVETEDVGKAVEEALHRLISGERDLAIHPNCGTNFATTGSLAGLAAGAAMLGAGKRWQDKVGRLPLAMTVATLALIIAQPLGFYIQEHITTSAELDGMEIVKITPSMRGRLKAHRIATRG
jgi:Domain of unknown function (DUF6391)